jgi:hypothetical protein
MKNQINNLKAVSTTYLTLLLLLLCVSPIVQAQDDSDVLPFIAAIPCGETQIIDSSFIKVGSYRVFAGEAGLEQAVAQAKKSTLESELKYDVDMRTPTGKPRVKEIICSCDRNAFQSSCKKTTKFLGEIKVSEELFFEKSYVNGFTRVYSVVRYEGKLEVTCGEAVNYCSDEEEENRVLEETIYENPKLQMQSISQQ